MKRFRALVLAGAAVALHGCNASPNESSATSANMEAVSATDATSDVGDAAAAASAGAAGGTDYAIDCPKDPRCPSKGAAD